MALLSEKDCVTLLASFHLAGLIGRPLLSTPRAMKDGAVPNLESGLA
jgi:hypothetical protein